MQKIKVKVLDKMIEKSLTSAEINFLIYVSHFQNDAGEIVGIYYKDICSELGISYQTFYDIKNSLVEKNIIFAEKKSYYDWDIKILNNDFTNQDYKESYINTGHNIFFHKEFYSLKAGEKLLTMQFMRISFSGRGSYNIGVEKFYDKYKKLFGITKRILQNYLSKLKIFFSVGIKEKQYWITPLVKIYKSNKTIHTDMNEYKKHAGKVICIREKLDYTEEQLENTTFLLKQYWDQFKNTNIDIFNIFLTAITKSLEKANVHIKKKKNWNKRLQPKLVHKVFREIMSTSGI